MTCEALWAEGACKEGLAFVEPLIDAGDPGLAEKLLAHREDWWLWAAVRGFDVFTGLKPETIEERGIFVAREIENLDRDTLFVRDCKINQVSGGRINAVLGGTVNQVLGGTIIKVLDGTVNRVSSGTINEVLGGTINEVWDGTINQVSSGTINEVLGGTINEVLDGTVNRVSGGTIDVVLGGTINAVYGGTINEVLDGTIHLVTDGTIHLVTDGTINQVLDGTVNLVTGSATLVWYSRTPPANVSGKAIVVDRSKPVVEVYGTAFKSIDLGKTGEVTA